MSNLRNNLYFKIVTLILCMLVTVFADAQMMGMTVNKRNILIGEKVEYILAMDKPTNDSIFFTVPDSIPHFEVIENYRNDSTTADGKKFWQTNIIFTSFDSGNFDFPELEFRIGKSIEKSQRLLTNAFRVNVGYMPIDKDGKPRDIKAVIEVDYFDWYWVKIGIGILATLIILFFLIKSLFKKKKLAPLVPNKNAYQDALLALEKLQKENEANQVEIKELHTKLASILKVYYGAVERTNFMNKTSKQVLDKLKSLELKSGITDQTQQALETGDATKFAKYKPLFVENETSINFIKNTIEELETLRHKKT